MSNLETTAERELLDLTERMPPRFDELELSAPASPAKQPATPPPIPARARARARATTALPLPAAPSHAPRAVPPPIPAKATSQIRAVPPPIPAAARKPTLPPPIPDRARRPSTSVFVASTPPADDSVDVDMTPPPAEAPLQPQGPAAPHRPTSAWDNFSALPAPKPRGRGTIPPLPTPNAQPFVIAPDAASGAQMFAAQPAPQLAVATGVASTIDDPTPLPRPLAYADLTSNVGELKFDLRRHASPNTKLVAGGLLVVGIVAIAFLATRASLDSDHGASPPTSPAAAALPSSPEPSTAEPPTAEPAIPAPQPSGIRVRSQPSGATVTLIDSGNTWELGKTPFAVALDRARAYEIIVALPGYDTKVVQIEPQADEVAIELAPSEPEPTAAEPAASEPAASEAPAPVTKPERKRTRPRTPRARVAVAAPTTAKGTLMVSSKPPCEIAIDGVSTALTTPQRSIELAAGKHKVKLINRRYKIDKTFEITIEPKRATKLIKDLMPSH